MIYSFDICMQQISKLQGKYPKLTIADASEKQIRLEGSILVYRSFNDFTLRKEYPLEIVIPIESEELPYVIDSSKILNSSYCHLNSGRRLCLETDIVIRNEFIQGFDLQRWIEKFVEPYYVTYEYFTKYGNFPNGERSHGYPGVLESYKELFKTDDLYKTCNIALFIKNKKYRGHLPCPCGSGERLRKCHGPNIMKFYNNSSLMNQLLCDIKHLEAEIREYNKRNNSKKTK